MKNLSLVLKNKNLAVLDQSYMEKFFEKKMPGYFSDFKRLISLRIDDRSSAQFKKAIKYSIRYLDKSNNIIKKSIRGNVPSLDTTYEAVIANEILKTLVKHGFNQGKLQVNKPIDYFPKLRMILYQSYPGTPLTEFIRRKVPAINDHIKKSAKWLLKLHSYKLKIGKLKNYKREKDEARYFIMNFRKYYPEIVDKSKLILKKVLEIKKTISPEIKKKAILIHGDYNPYNIIINDFNTNKLAVIDFGNAWRFDPLADVGNFLIQLELLFWQGLVMDKKYLEKMKRNFLAQYLKGLKGNKKKIMQRINLYQVWWAMQVTSYNVVIWPTYQAKKRIVRGLIPLAQRLVNKL